MMKNIFLLLLLSWVSFSYGKHPVAQESTADADSFKVEKPAQPQEAQRSVAGGKAKKPASSAEDEAIKKMPLSETDSEVRYWQYSE